uniref:LRRCT domain-containing protein n=1 Tax=Buteo japonicus TaxID=224669 RepID=A0A8C0HRQ2_9AVES
LLPGLCPALPAPSWQRWLLLLVGIQLARGQCPEQCQCVRTAQVECSGAGITTVPSPIPANAMTLQIINTRIAELGDASFGNASLLIGLRIEKNNLSRISPGAFQHLLPHLEKLLLDNNFIEVLPPQGFFGLNKLKLLTLSSNHITELPCCLFDTMPHLRELDLGRNSLATLPDGIFVNLTSLGKLILSHNQLAALPRGAFTGLSKLLDLQLDTNQLSALDDEVFASLPNLKTLNLRKNQLESVPRGLLDPLKKLSSVYLSGNPWRCDCNLCYLHSWILGNSEKVKLSTQVSCKSPPHLAGQAVTSLRDDHLTCQATLPLSASFTPSLPFTSTSSQGISMLLSPGALPTAAPTTDTRWHPDTGGGCRCLTRATGSREGEQWPRNAGDPAPDQLETSLDPGHGPLLPAGSGRGFCLHLLPIPGGYLQGASSPWGRRSQGLLPRAPASSPRRITGCVGARASIVTL